MFSYSNGLNLCTEHLDMFWSIWNLILWREAGNKRSSCSDYSKHGAFIIGQSEQQFKIQSHFGIFDTIIGDGKWYGKAESQALKSICRLFENIWLLYSMKYISGVFLV